ncbi:hypothetical protein [uncultured Lamprocystis sp.]|jgi:hypothetical protein|uniref:hypothetical protein n=1 Tax=uncultured Lamprocystis sp. TaxID=543132 RepID=UPI0025F87DCB|nr:hypothetical protein [uncultured Lamprocystis sp.]
MSAAHPEEKRIALACAGEPVTVTGKHWHFGLYLCHVGDLPVAPPDTPDGAVWEIIDGVTGALISAGDTRGAAIDAAQLRLAGLKALTGLSTNALLADARRQYRERHDAD